MLIHDVFPELTVESHFLIIEILIFFNIHKYRNLTNEEDQLVLNFSIPAMKLFGNNIFVKIIFGVHFKDLHNQQYAILA